MSFRMSDAWVENYIKGLRQKEVSKHHKVLIPFSTDRFIQTDQRFSFNVGYLFLQKIYYQLGLPAICKNIRKKNAFEYDLDVILSRLIYGRILYPSSKLSCFEQSKDLIEQPAFSLHQVYRALSVLAENMDDIQAKLYQNSKNVIERKTGVLFYDCTNYFFEIEQEAGLKQYGPSKEHRPNPINQAVIDAEARFDGFYAVYTNLEDDPAEIAKINHDRWEIEESFRIMKSEFEARPVYLQRDDRIKAHFLTCFIALMIYRILKKQLDDSYSSEKIISTLRKMNMRKLDDYGYIPNYTRTTLTDDLHKNAGFRTDYELTTPKSMAGVLRKSKTSEKK